MKRLCDINLFVLLIIYASDTIRCYGGNKQGFSTDDKTLIVPRSNKIQIAFADDGSDPRTKLHMDLLRLYKQVMEEVLERNKLISTVQTLLDKVSQMDELATRVHRLEQDLGIVRGEVGAGRHVHRVTDPDNTDTNKNWDRDEYQGTTTSFAETGLDSDSEIAAIRVRLHQQEKMIRRIQEDLRIQSKLTAEQGRDLQRQREHLDRLRATTENLEHKAGQAAGGGGGGGGTGAGGAILPAETEDGYAGEVAVLRANIATVESKLHKLRIDFDWHDFRINMQQNSTDSLEREVEDIETTVSDLFTKSGSLQTTVTQARADSIQCKTKLHANNKKILDIENHIRKIALALSKAGNTNITLHHNYGDYQVSSHDSHNLDSNVYGFVEDATSKMFRMVHKINSSHHHLITSDKHQQKQLDELSLDLESLKDELDDYFSKLKDLDTQGAVLKDDVKGSRRDHEKLRRKVERMQRDLHAVLGALDAYGMTTQPSPSHVVVRRTTQPHRTLVTRSSHVTLPDVTRTFVTPSTRSRSLTADPAPKVTHSPDTHKGDATVEAEPGEPSDLVDESEAKDPQSAALEPNRLANCTVSGFGEAHMIRAFPRMLMGSWGKDVAANDDKIYAMLNYIKTSHVREYGSEADLRENKITIVHRMPFKCTGTGHLVYKGSIYCNKYKTNRMMKFTIETGEHISVKLHDAAFNNTYPYTSGSMTDFDFAVDEKGLWVIYGSYEHKGNLVVARLNPEDLQIHVHDRFVTTFPKTSASNTFMACGNLYVTENKKDGPNTIQYIYDTTADRAIPMEENKIRFAGNRTDHLTMLDYNSKEHKLYGWRMSNNWDGELVTYDVNFIGT